MRVLSGDINVWLEDGEGELLTKKDRISAAHGWKTLSLTPWSDSAAAAEANENVKEKENRTTSVRLVLDNSFSWLRKKEVQIYCTGSGKSL